MPAALAIPAAIGAAQAVVGLINSGKTKREAEELARTRPVRTTSKYATDELALSESELSRGMSARAERAYKEQQDKALSGSLDAIMKSGGSVNNVGQVYGAGENGRQNLAMLQDQIRMNQVNNLVKSYQMMNSEEQANFAFNKVAPWKDKTVANGMARQQSQNQIWGGINTLGGAATGYFQGKEQERIYDKYFGDKGYGDQPEQPFQPMTIASMRMPTAASGYEEPPAPIDPNAYGSQQGIGGSVSNAMSSGYAGTNWATPNFNWKR